MPEVTLWDAFSCFFLAGITCSIFSYIANDLIVKNEERKNEIKKLISQLEELNHESSQLEELNHESSQDS